MIVYHAPPPALRGKDLEAEALRYFAWAEKQGIATAGPYGVKATRTRSGESNTPGAGDWQIHSSLPDIEGVNHLGQQFIFDCKVCSQASFSWDKYRRASASKRQGARHMQLRHMRRRARFGVGCFWLFHWNRRQLKERTVEPETWAVPILTGDVYWDRVETGVARSLSLEECRDRGRLVYWATPGQLVKPVPMILNAVGLPIPSPGTSPAGSHSGT